MKKPALWPAFLAIRPTRSGSSIRAISRRHLVYYYIGLLHPGGYWIDQFEAHRTRALSTSREFVSRDQHYLARQTMLCMHHPVDSALRYFLARFLHNFPTHRPSVVPPLAIVDLCSWMHISRKT